ncbi:kinase-like domain-containing protein [Syncephalis plumigaleata]|nr:kinase-like domain-containing protein [Syncephalis plumigaleata]
MTLSDILRASFFLTLGVGSLLSNDAICYAASTGTPMRLSSSQSASTPAVADNIGITDIRWNKESDKPGIFTARAKKMNKHIFLKCFQYTTKQTLQTRVNSPTPPPAACGLPPWAPNLFVQSFSPIKSKEGYGCMVLDSSPHAIEMFEYLNKVVDVRKRHLSAYNSFLQLVVGFSYLHCKGIGHADIKWENVLSWNGYDDNLVLKIIDFDLSVQLRKDHKEELVCNTPGYCAPETLNGDDPVGDASKADSWSLAVLMYYYLTSRMPYMPTGQDIYDADRNFCQIPKSEDDWVEAHGHLVALRFWICKLMEPRPEKRPTPYEIFRDGILPYNQKLEQAKAMLAAKNKAPK